MTSSAGGHVLITGGAGFIGSHLASRLSSRCQVVLFDSLRRNALDLAPEISRSPHLRLVTGDILDREAVTREARGASVVVHLAAIAGVSSYYRQPVETLNVNIQGTINAVSAAIESRAPAFLLYSSSEVYGDRGVNVDESSPCVIGPPSDRRWVYATSKLAAENYALRMGEAAGLRTTVLRPFNVYGPRQVGEGAIANFCRAAVCNEPLRVYGDGSAVRAWCYVSDMVDATVAAIDSPAASGQIINVGNPSATATTLELARMVAALVPSVRIEHAPAPASEIPRRIPNIDRARRLLGFEPAVSLNEGLRRTLDAFRTAGVRV